MPSLSRCLVAEALGTFVLVFLGCGAVHSAVLTGSLTGLWQVGIVWGMAVMLAVYACGATSGAHLNPAVTCALAAWRGFPWQRVGFYIAAQITGAMAAAAVLFILYRGPIAEKNAADAEHSPFPGLHTAMCYGEFYPNPGLIVPADMSDAAKWGAHLARVSHLEAFLAEAIGTALLALVVFATTDPQNAGGPAQRFAPVFIGLAVAALICVIAPLTQACFNPARDFGPRLFTFVAGWGSTAMPGPNGIGFLTVYIVAPTVGAIAGGGVYELALRKSNSGDGR